MPDVRDSFLVVTSDLKHPDRITLKAERSGKAIRPKQVIRRNRSGERWFDE